MNWHEDGDLIIFLVFVVAVVSMFIVAMFFDCVEELVPLKVHCPTFYEQRARGFS